MPPAAEARMQGETWVELVGTLAAVCTTASFLPQAVRILRTRDTHAISLAMYVVFSSGIALWLVYGLAIGSAPVIGANAVTLVFVLAILAAKIRYG
jgi:MtN3 and saliva related transmembrane protein